MNLCHLFFLVLNSLCYLLKFQITLPAIQIDCGTKFWSDFFLQRVSWFNLIRLFKSWLNGKTFSYLYLLVQYHISLVLFGLVRYRSIFLFLKKVKNGSRQLQTYFNPSHPSSGKREKNNLNFYFHTSLWWF